VIRIHVTREDDATGKLDDLGELRLAELGGPVVVYRETSDGHSVMRDLRAALACLSPRGLTIVRASLAYFERLQRAPRTVQA
jgi:hypothetical protein